jgi:ribonuclease Z
MATKEETDRFYRYHGKIHNDTFEIIAKKTKMKVQVFKCDHCIPTISYGFTEPKHKLKTEYQGIPGKELACLKMSGTEITQEVLYKRFAYVCDTTIKVLEKHPEIIDYPVIFIECTFLYHDDLELASTKKHIHWEQLEPYVRKFPNTQFMLIHFSQRYSDEDINNFFKKVNLPNVNWW